MFSLRLLRTTAVTAPATSALYRPECVSKWPQTIGITGTELALVSASPDGLRVSTDSACANIVSSIVITFTAAVTAGDTTATISLAYPGATTAIACDAGGCKLCVSSDAGSTYSATGASITFDQTCSPSCVCLFVCVGVVDGGRCE